MSSCSVQQGSCWPGRRCPTWSITGVPFLGSTISTCGAQREGASKGVYTSRMSGFCSASDWIPSDCSSRVAEWLRPQQRSLGGTGTHQLAWGRIAQKLFNDGAACGQGGWEAGSGGSKGWVWAGLGRGNLMWYSGGRARPPPAAAVLHAQAWQGNSPKRFVVAGRAQRAGPPMPAAGGLAARVAAAGAGASGGAANPAAAPPAAAAPHPGSPSRRSAATFRPPTCPAPTAVAARRVLLSWPSCVLG